MNSYSSMFSILIERKKELNSECFSESCEQMKIRWVKFTHICGSPDFLVSRVLELMRVSHMAAAAYSVCVDTVC